uniref:Fork-head domain-containing protein n=1 Tax=Syphacia muris TaxID=451379 RepID=A0A0N5B0E9_9BILA
MDKLRIILNLISHNVCSWPQCGQPCENIAAFLHHLSTTHVLDERGTQQCRTQIETVDNLEHRLTKEKIRLEAMLQHLQMKQLPESNTSISGAPLQSESPLVSPAMIETKPELMQTEQSPNVSVPLLPANTSTASEESRVAATPRKRVSDKSVVPMAGDLVRNRDYYRNNDVRPPYTYASLIRQAIMESKDCQLTLNEIYQWFTESFAYFRRNAATWKNAVRHNLSLHKCFARVEQNVKGAVWTVDDSEFYRRRPQRSHARSTPPTPKNDNPLSLLSSAATAASLATDDILRTAAAQAQEQTLQSFLNNTLLTDSESLSSDKNPTSPTAPPTVHENQTQQVTAQQALSKYEPIIGIKEEQVSPRLVVDEET